MVIAKGQCTDNTPIRPTDYDPLGFHASRIATVIWSRPFSRAVDYTREQQLNHSVRPPSQRKTRITRTLTPFSFHQLIFNGIHPFAGGAKICFPQNRKSFHPLSGHRKQSQFKSNHLVPFIIRFCRQMIMSDNECGWNLELINEQDCCLHSIT